MHAYRGWRSTKLHLALITMGLITLVYGLAGFPADQFGTYCTALITATGIFSGASVVERFSKPQIPPPVDPA